MRLDRRFALPALFSASDISSPLQLSQILPLSQDPVRWGRVDMGKEGREKGDTCDNVKMKNVN